MDRYTRKETYRLRSRSEDMYQSRDDLTDYDTDDVTEISYDVVSNYRLEMGVIARKRQ